MAHALWAVLPALGTSFPKPVLMPTLPSCLCLHLLLFALRLHCRSCCSAAIAANKQRQPSLAPLRVPPSLCSCLCYLLLLALQEKLFRSARRELGGVNLDIFVVNSFASLFQVRR